MSAADDWVVDASVLVDLVAAGAWSEKSREALTSRQLHTPAHVDVEVTSALARLLRTGSLTEDDARRGLERFAAAPLTRHPLPPLLKEAWALSSQLRIADAFYVALADTLGTRVLTLDARLARATRLAVLPGG